MDRRSNWAALSDVLVASRQAGGGCLSVASSSPLSRWYAVAKKESADWNGGVTISRQGPMLWVTEAQRREIFAIHVHRNENIRTAYISGVGPWDLGARAGHPSLPPPRTGPEHITHKKIQIERVRRGGRGIILLQIPPSP